MKKDNKRTGFTLVELLVVIAIVAILSVVSVVGYTSFTKKAKVSNDISLTTQMNTILQSNEAAGETFETPHDAISALKEGGLDASKLTPTTNGYNYIYDQEGKRMILVDGDNKVVAPVDTTLSGTNERYFYIVSTETELNTYTETGWSVYLKDGFNMTSTELNVKAGIDVGDCLNISKVNYKNDSNNAKTVIIRTTAGSLNINAPKDTVNHYSSIEHIVINSIANNSYHEYGNVSASLEIKNGRVVVEENASIKELVIPSDASATNVEILSDSVVETVTIDSTSAKVKVEDNATIENLICSDEVKANVTLPDNSKINNVSKTHVENISELNEALNKKEKYIVFDNDISGYIKNTDDYGMCIKNDVIIDGNNYTFTTTATRGIALDYFTGDVNVTIRDLKLLVDHSPTYTKNINGNNVTDYTRGIQVYREDYGGIANLLIDNVEIVGNETNKNEGVHYGINICDGAVVDLKVINSHIIGYAALNLWSAYYKVNISNSTLEGINSYDGNSNFSTICLEGNLEGMHADSVDVEIVNSKIITKASGSAKQSAIKFNEKSVDNMVSLVNTELKYEGNNTVFAEDYGNKNKLYVDGVEYQIKQAE